MKPANTHVKGVLICEFCGYDTNRLRTVHGFRLCPDCVALDK